jgi:hypothetical protein
MIQAIQGQIFFEILVDASILVKCHIMATNVLTRIVYCRSIDRFAFEIINNISYKTLGQTWLKPLHYFHPDIRVGSENSTTEENEDGHSHAQRNQPKSRKYFHNHSFKKTIGLLIPQPSLLCTKQWECLPESQYYLQRHRI